MAGIYIHIPFCKQKCSYCDFHFSTTFSSYRDALVQTLVQEIEQRKIELSEKTLSSIYFGGGTPSLLNEHELQLLMQAIYKNYAVADHPEITLEANPDDISNSNLNVWNNAGINRLSIGLQSFREEDLTWMNRAHTAREALTCIPRAQDAGFENLSIDLIYGLPNFTLSDWEKAVKQAVQLQVPHISAYCLTVEEKTALNKWVKEGKLTPAGEDTQSEQFLLLSTFLQDESYEHYEISNFAKAGYRAVHNSNYWTGERYVGIGPSAHSFDGSMRRWNIANNTRYIQLFQQNETYFETEKLSKKDRWNELLLTGLRTSMGVRLDQLSKLYPLDETFQQRVNFYLDQEMMNKDMDRLVLSPKGRLQADHIASEFFKLD